MNKKRYAGLLWTKTEKWDKMDSKVGWGLRGWDGFGWVGFDWVVGFSLVNGAKFPGCRHARTTQTHTRAIRTPQGIETVRRDNCGLVRQVVATCLDRILIDRWGGGGERGLCLLFRCGEGANTHFLTPLDTQLTTRPPHPHPNQTKGTRARPWTTSRASSPTCCRTRWT
jgi:hypothetical protein